MHKMKYQIKNSKNTTQEYKEHTMQIKQYNDTMNAVYI